MLTFWIIAGGMLLAGLAALAPALLRKEKVRLASNREQNIAIAREHLAEIESQLRDGLVDLQTFDKEKEEIEKELVEDVASEEPESPVTGSGKGGAALVVSALVVPVLAISLYLMLGSPAHIDGTDPHATLSSGQDKAPTAEELVTILEERVRANPDDPDSWFMLGRMYATSSRFDDAVRAYEKLVEVTDRHPTAMVVLADALAMQQQGRITGRPLEIVKQVLEVDPDNATALWLAGRGSAELGEYEQSLDYYSRAAEQLKDKPELMAQLTEQIEQVRQIARDSGIELPAVELPAAAPAVTIEINVGIDPALQGEVQPTDTLFVFARLPDGPPMPIAAIKRQAGDLPMQVVLDDSMLLRPGKKLSEYPELVLAARIAKSGQPMAASGDLQSKPVPVSPGYDGSVVLTIDQRVP